MKRRLVFGLAVAMVMLAWGRAGQAEAADAFRAPSFPNVTATNAWLVLQPFAVDLAVRTQGMLLEAPTDSETASNTFLLLVIGVNAAGALLFDINSSSPTTPGSFACPPPESGYSGEVSVANVFIALVLERVSQALDGCSLPEGCVAYTKFASGTIPVIRNLGGNDFCDLGE